LGALFHAEDFYYSGFAPLAVEFCIEEALSGADAGNFLSSSMSRDMGSAYLDMVLRYRNWVEGVTSLGDGPVSIGLFDRRREDNFSVALLRA